MWPSQADVTRGVPPEGGGLERVTFAVVLWQSGGSGPEKSVSRDVALTGQFLKSFRFDHKSAQTLSLL
jgi:hypothetical protein